MIGSLILFVLLVLFYIVIVDIITIFFRLTGLTQERARFQVISMLTNSGFTTRESETVVNSKLRRRLAQATMLFGYSFTVTILSAAVTMFSSLGRSQLSSILMALPIPALLLVAVYFLRRSVFLKTKFDAWIEKIASRIMFGRDSNQVVLVEDYGSMVVAHIYLHTVPELLQDRTLAEAQLTTRYNLMVMLVKSRDEEAQQANGSTVLHAGDTIMVLGAQKDIREVFEFSRKLSV